LRVEAGEITFRERGDEVIQRVAVAEDAGGDFRGQGLVTIVAERLALRGERRGQVRAAAVEGAKDVEGRDAGRGDHAGGWSTVPGASGWPARNSRAGIGRLPSV